MTDGIYILNASHIPSREYFSITKTLERIFHSAIHVADLTLDLQKAFDESRDQYSSGALLSQCLHDKKLDPPGKCIIVVDVDLFIPVLTFIFGEAQFGGSAAIVSTHRLADQFYGLPRNNAKLLERLEKEIVHELGHTFGLYHCRQFECVMRSSTYVEEIDLKLATPCTACSSALQNPEFTEMNNMR